MNIQTIAEHSIDFDLLPKNGNILDLGCRDFLFAKELTRLGHDVFTVDPDSAVLGDHIVAYTCYPQMIYKHYMAAISNENGLCGIKRTNDPQATTIIKQQTPLAKFNIPMYTIASFSKKLGIDFWDVIKLDIEGQEFEVIMSMKKPYARQLSIEMHLHTSIYGEAEVLMMENKLLELGYYPVKHDRTRQHGLSYNYWDSLWILV